MPTDQVLQLTGLLTFSFKPACLQTGVPQEEAIRWVSKHSMTECGFFVSAVIFLFRPLLVLFWLMQTSPFPSPINKRNCISELQRQTFRAVLCKLHPRKPACCLPISWDRFPGHWDENSETPWQAKATQNLSWNVCPFHAPGWFSRGLSYGHHCTLMELTCSGRD